MDSNCWITAGRISSHGYAMLGEQYLHRIMWENYHGYLIPNGLQIDHRCRNRACINPEHLELVAPRINYLRGEGVGAKAARRAACKYGHLYENVTYNGRKRFCRECNRRRVRERYQRLKSQV